MWHVVFYMPGEREIPLLARCRQHADVRLLGVVDAEGSAPGTPLAEVMGVRVVQDLASLEIPDNAYVIATSELCASDAFIRSVETDGLTVVNAEAFQKLVAGEIGSDPQSNLVPDKVSIYKNPTAHADAAPPAPAPPRSDLDAALTTLNHIENALDNDRLLPWLLSIAVSSVGGANGSLMLHDRLAGQLYIAAATGLSDQILFTTRQPLEDGIAGRVARSGQAELVAEAPSGGPKPERGDLTSAVCVPLRHDGEILGVLNVNAAPGSVPFTKTHLSDLVSVGNAVSRILRAPARTRSLSNSRLRRQLDRDFRELAQGGGELETVLAGWSAALAMALEAEHAAIATLREDGTLLLAEGTAEGDTRTGTIPQQHPAWNDVLQSGRPVLVRHDSRNSENEDGDGITMYFLPVGPAPVCAVLAVRYGDPADAHRFQMEIEGILVFLERRLVELLQRHEERDHLHRLRELTTYVGQDYRRRNDDPAQRLSRLATFVKRLTGALEIVFLPNDSQLAGPRETAARDLLERTEERGWMIAVTSPGFSDGSSSTCLAVRGTEPGDNSGFVLFGKRRLHPADSVVFTTFDAVLARHLANQMPGPEDHVAAPSEKTAPVSASTAGALLLSLAREIDRADRYHVAFSLSVFACGDPNRPAAELLAHVAAHLRASDLLFPGDDGHLFVLAPEEIHAVAHMEKRAVTALREVTGDPALPVHSGHALYPGRDSTPEALIQAALASLRDRSGDED